MSHWLVSPALFQGGALGAAVPVALCPKQASPPSPYCQMVTHGLHCPFAVRLLVAFIVVTCGKPLDSSFQTCPVTTTGSHWSPLLHPLGRVRLHGCEIWPWTLISNISVYSRQITLKFLNSLGHNSLPSFLN